MPHTKSQATDTVLMIRPSDFSFNNQTSDTNIFQRTDLIADDETIHEKALKEFDELVKKLRDHKLYVIVLQDPGTPATPDSIFPNNWISFHGDHLILYPMLAENRRRERRGNWINLLKDEFRMDQQLDFSGYEKHSKFLEGTGSLVLDRIHHRAYANLSSRTNIEPLSEFATKMNYELVFFTSKDSEGKEIYHTNVLMAIGEKTAVICSEVIMDRRERALVYEKLAEHHEVVEISADQMMKFAGNMLLVKNRDEEKFWVMSEQAFNSLTSSQRDKLNKDGEFIYSNLETIETIGGGSARCMICEVM